MRFYVRLLSVWMTIPKRMVMSMLRRIHALFADQIIFVHTPKCAGSYVYKQYGLNSKLRIRPIGHGRLLSVSPKDGQQISGLIREPADWYMSYYKYCRYGLTIAPQSRYNFPGTHPIPYFSSNTEVDADAMVDNMADPAFVATIIEDGVVANLYTRDIPGVYEFMARTGCGFWTWTMMYHFGLVDIDQLRDRDDVLQEAGRIAVRTRFIRQENIDEDVSEHLGLAQRAGERVNSQGRSSSERLSDGSIDKVYALDGDVAAVLGGYSR